MPSMAKSPSELAQALKSIRDGMRFFGQPVDDMTDEQLEAFATNAANGVAAAGISVQEFVKAHTALIRHI